MFILVQPLLYYEKRVCGTVGLVCATLAFFIPNNYIYIIEVTQTQLSFIVSPLPIAHSAIIASLKMTPLKYTRWWCWNTIKHCISLAAPLFAYQGMAWEHWYMTSYFVTAMIAVVSWLLHTNDARSKWIQLTLQINLVMNFFFIMQYEYERVSVASATVVVEIWATKN